MVGAAALIAVVSGAGIIGHAAAASKQSHSTQPGLAARALEPGFTGTFIYRNDNFRTGQNLAESILTPSTVNPAQFGLIFTDAIDGAAYAQPLYVPNVAIPNQGTHNVIYVATENDSVYAFDADQPGPALWQTSFIDPAQWNYRGAGDRPGMRRPGADHRDHRDARDRSGEGRTERCT